MLIRIVFHLLALLPLRALHALGAFAGWLLWVTHNGRRAVALKNIALCQPQLTPQQQVELARESIKQEMKSVLESPFFWLAPVDKLLASVVETRGHEHVDRALAHGKGVIVLTPHLGGWEAPGHVYASQRPITAIYKRQGGAVEDLGVRGRTRTGAKVVPADKSAGRAMFNLLQKGESMYFMPDQDPPEGRGVFAPFFGVPAHTPSLVGRLVQETGAHVVVMYGERLPKGRGFIAHYHEPPAEIYDADPVKAATAMNASIERCIRECPEQYWWGYKRFRRRPPGEAPAY